MDNREPDIVTVILQRVAEAMPGISEELVHQVEEDVRRAEVVCAETQKPSYP